MAIKRSQQNFARPRAEVEQAVIDSHSPDSRITDAKESGGGNKGDFTKPSFVKKVGTDQKGAPKKNGNGAHNSQTGQNQNGTNQRKQSPKTADDLKDILAGMTSQGTKSQPETKAQGTSNNEVKKTEPALQPAKPEPKVVAPEPKDQPTKPDSTPAAKSLPATKESPAVANTNYQTPQANESRPPVATQKPAASATRPNQSTKNSHQTTSADDLRAVLAKLADKANTTDHAKSKPAHQRSSAGQPQAAHKSPTTSQDLQRTRQGMVQHKNQQTNNAKTTHSSQARDNNHQSQPAANQPKGSQTDLQTALAKVVNRANEAQDSATENIQKPTQSTQPPAKPTISETTPAMVYKQSAEPAVGGVRQPAYTPHEQSDAPDINTAKKILRHSGKERPPGT